MSRVNDVGGQTGFGEVSIDGDEPAFAADWEARVFALNAALVRRGVYNLDQFRDAVERLPPQAYLSASYFERWLLAIEQLTAQLGDAEPGNAALGDAGPGNAELGNAELGDERNPRDEAGGARG